MNIGTGEHRDLGTCLGNIGTGEHRAWGSCVANIGNGKHFCGIRVGGIGTGELL